MTRAKHCEVEEAFKASQMPNVRISYVKDQNIFQIFPNIEFKKPEMDRSSIN
jgi:hypothetical protein